MDEDTKKFLEEAVKNIQSSAEGIAAKTNNSILELQNKIEAQDLAINAFGEKMNASNSAISGMEEKTKMEIEALRKETTQLNFRNFDENSQGEKEPNKAMLAMKQVFGDNVRFK